MQLNGSVILDEGPNETKLRGNKHEMIPHHHFAIEGKSLTCAPQNHDHSTSFSIVDDPI